MRVDVLPDRAGLMRAAADEFIKVAGLAQAAHRRFSVALSGGSTPAALYTLLAAPDVARQVDWSGVHIFWGDERCVPPDHPQSNYRMANETLLSRVPLPAENIHRIRGEDEPKQAAAAYEELLRGFLRGESLDLVLLGMGDNGHTASLFPGLPGVTESVRWVLAQYVEVVSMWRVTMTPVVINAARHVRFLVAGAEKADRLRDVLEGPAQVEVLPSQAIQPARGELRWLVDSAAAARLEHR
jgi:6-phosphogluconolactonase